MKCFEKYKTPLNKSWDLDLFKIIDKLRILEVECDLDLCMERNNLLSLISKDKLDIEIINKTIESIYEKQNLNSDIEEIFKPILNELFKIKKEL